jgi:hypothetical protein
MDKSCDFLLGASDPEIAGLLASAGGDPRPRDRRFNQEEEFFLVLDRPFVVPSFEIHHTVSSLVPGPGYLDALRQLVRSWVDLVPEVFAGLSWYFNPRDLFHPVFVQVLSARGQRFLSLLRPDLTFRGRHGEILDRGSNDLTPRYSTRTLFLEAEALPLATWETGPEGKKLFLAKLFEDTYHGEQGLGYLRTGRWIDTEITKLLTRAVVAPGTKTFPFYPLRCRHQTLSVGCVDLTEAGRKRAASHLAAAWPLVAPWAEALQRELKDEGAREPLADRMKAQWGDRLSHRWGGYRLEAYLNDHDQKEYRYHGV